jgi:hypothetical protein
MIRKSGTHFSDEIMLNSLLVHDLFAEVDSTSADHELKGREATRHARVGSGSRRHHV